MTRGSERENSGPCLDCTHCCLGRDDYHTKTIQNITMRDAGIKLVDAIEAYVYKGYEGGFTFEDFNRRKEHLLAVIAEYKTLNPEGFTK